MPLKRSRMPVQHSRQRTSKSVLVGRPFDQLSSHLALLPKVTMPLNW
jgi:hypothetical protein